MYFTNVDGTIDRAIPHPMLIVNKDRDRVYFLNLPLYTEPICNDDNEIMGLNLFSGKHCLGDFDSVQAAQDEMQNIMQSTKWLYFVSGFYGGYWIWDLKFILKKIRLAWRNLRRLFQDEMAN